MTIRIESYLERQKERIDAELSNCIKRFCPSKKINESIWYAIEAGGKRIRPALCMAACTAVGGKDETVIPAACALEMIHTYSLIHDDLPALDNDDLRRGKPTCHIRFGEAIAILTGDALLTMAFEVMTEAGLKTDKPHARAWLKAAHIIATASGCLGMLDGQVRDLVFEGVKLSQRELEKLHQLKTGAIIRASVHCGALLADGNNEQTDRLLDYAGNIGLAFQVMDDILNVKGDPEIMGKAVGTDSDREKNTFPALLGLEKSEKYAESLIDAALESLSTFNSTADPLRELARFIVERNR